MAESSERPKKQSPPSNIHAGHRSRMRARYAKKGINELTQTDILEMLLYYPILQKDTVPQANALLDRFGTLTNVLMASNDELGKADDISPGVKQYISIWRDTFQFIVRDMIRGIVLDNSWHTKQIIRFLCMFDREEHVYAIFLSPELEIIRADCIASGTKTSTRVPISQLLEIADECGCNLYLLLHSHPNNSGTPSQDDLSATYRIRYTTARQGLDMADHYVYGMDDIVSIRESEGEACDFSVPAICEFTEEEQKEIRKIQIRRQRRLNGLKRRQQYCPYL